MCFIVKVLPWIHSAAAKSEMTHDAFRHLFSDDWVYCQLNSECVSGQCEGGVCLQSLTQSNLEKLGPSPRCKEDEKQPCHDGQECKVPACNRYGNACWCPQSENEVETQPKREEKLKAEKRLFVRGRPENWQIECLNNYDCPTDWFCEEELCAAPLTFPSGAWASLSSPTVGGIG